MGAGEKEREEGIAVLPHPCRGGEGENFAFEILKGDFFSLYARRGKVSSLFLRKVEGGGLGLKGGNQPLFFFLPVVEGEAAIVVRLFVI